MKSHSIRFRQSLLRLTRPDLRSARVAELRLLGRAARSSVPWLWSARRAGRSTLLDALRANAMRAPHGLALEMGEDRWSWSELETATSRVAHVLARHGVRAGDVVALVGNNHPQYVALVLGLCRMGAVASLINPKLLGRPLEHALTTCRARFALVQARLLENAAVSMTLSQSVEHILDYGTGSLDDEMMGAPSSAFEPAKQRSDNDFVYIYTSGTTGLPKPCRITHARALVAAAVFGPLVFEFREGDKLYCALPLHHSSALLIGFGSCLLTETPCALRESLSISAFFSDAERYGATAMLYIGELCRYLVDSPPLPAERSHRIRIAVGNGLDSRVWRRFQDRFRIPVIREFYGATEAPGALVNLTGKLGSIGHVPLPELGLVRLARYDIEQNALARDERGWCIECRPGEVGELLFALDRSLLPALGQFAGYTDRKASSKKVLENVFSRGDRFYRSGDLMRQDEAGFFYFVDRVGDSFRFKGENVSASEVEQLVASAPGVIGAAVCGIRIPEVDGQPGFAAIACNGAFEPALLWRAVQELPGYAQPRFVRIVSSLETTETFKMKRTRRGQQDVDPSRVDDPVYLRRDTGYTRLTVELWQQIIEGRLRL